MSQLISKAQLLQKTGGCKHKTISKSQWRSISVPIMELFRSLPSPALSGHLFSSTTQVYKLKNLCELYSKKMTYTQRRFYKHITCNIRYSQSDGGASISNSGYIRKDSHVSSNIPLQDARVLYSVAPATGHNKEAHPESNLRVPAIVDALERLELTSKSRGPEVFEIQNFQPATVDDIAIVHERAYVAGLEKTFQESLVAAGAGISLVDSVVEASRIRMDPPVGFALIRPPGHHAVPKGPMVCAQFKLAVVHT
ncbi:uncharacterized protein A4U43_C02F6430 [Asparagus officinalis]|uniref:Uncharacterized protein n=1 Tax=Asparagus officinalis TaxID=4686 RepID=A0A5P1FGE8_ASPOF|nr:uncharacterized protein A4U43_C02F6430 [Asparagus officinalis]